MQRYTIVIGVDLEDDIEAERVLDEVRKALHPLPVPEDRNWHFTIMSEEERHAIPHGHRGG